MASRCGAHTRVDKRLNREGALRRLASEQFDILIVGGGATGLGAALDASARGYRTALIDAYDFAKATSSRSTKLIHGGVRYLQQGNIPLVREALLERARLYANAPATVHELRFIVPAYRYADLAYYWAGLKVYDALAPRSPFSRSRMVSTHAAGSLMPGLNSDRLRGAVSYSDAQFDDARLAITLARTAFDHDAVLANYVSAQALVVQNARLSGVAAIDTETGDRFTIAAKVVINAAGIFVDEIRRLHDPNAAPMLAFSRGSHIVLARRVLGESNAALLVPRTSDGRVLFAMPWLGHTLAGTTDIAVGQAEVEPLASDAEIDYIIATLNRYLATPISRSDVLSTWAGLRSLVNRSAAATAQLSREHAVSVSASGLITVAGGKWTTYRKMAQDVIDIAAAQARLPKVPCRTLHLRLHESPVPQFSSMHDTAQYFAREEMARTIEDVLARRTRALFLDANAAIAQAPAVAAGLAEILKRDDAWKSQQLRSFNELAHGYAPRAVR